MTLFKRKNFRAFINILSYFKKMPLPLPYNLELEFSALFSIYSRDILDPHTARGVFRPNSHTTLEKNNYLC